MKINDILNQTDHNSINNLINCEFRDYFDENHKARKLAANDLNEIIRLQGLLSKQGSLKQNSREQLLESMKNGVWVGVFNGEELVAYTAFDFQKFGENVLQYFKVTAKNTNAFKGFQTKTFILRKKLGEMILEKAEVPIIGGYCTVQPGNSQSEKNIVAAGLEKLFFVEGLYGVSPEGDRDIYGCGDIPKLKEILSKPSNK